MMQTAHLSCCPSVWPACSCWLLVSRRHARTGTNAAHTLSRLLPCAAAGGPLSGDYAGAEPDAGGAAEGGGRVLPRVMSVSWVLHPGSPQTVHASGLIFHTALGTQVALH